jgi:hypothetical protein
MKDEIFSLFHPSSFNIMPAVVRPFDSYKIYHFAGPRPLEGEMAAVWVPCFQQGKQIGSLSFLSDAKDVQDNDYDEAKDQILLFYHIDRFTEVITTLRYESPLFLMLNTDTWEGALITKELEPVGEEESS